jgi:hypothetical protein
MVVDIELRLVEVRLERWAPFIVKDSHALGYPKASPIYRMRNGAIIQGTRRHDIEALAGHEEEWATDRAISEMPLMIRLPLLRSCHLKYDRGGRLIPHVSTVERNAKDLGLSVRTFHDRVRLAKYWLLGRFQARPNRSSTQLFSTRY